MKNDFTYHVLDAVVASGDLSDGLQVTNTLLMGDIASAEVDGPSGGFWEFEFDDSGRAVRLLGRSQADDSVILSAERVGG